MATAGWRAARFALAYFVASEIGYTLSLGPSVGGTFWPPSGLTLAVLLLAPFAEWPALVVAGLLANFASDQLHHQTLGSSIGYAIANLTDPLIGATLLRRLLGPSVSFTRLPEIVVFALVQVFVAAPIAAVIGGVTNERWSLNPPGFAVSWRTWWVGNAVGALVLAPVIVRTLTNWKQLPGTSRAKWLEGATFVLVLVTATQAIFASAPASMATPFLLFPVLLWASVGFGLPAVGGALCLVVLLTTWDTAGGRGPFAAEHLSLGDRLIALQIYVGVMAVSFQTLALLWEERSRATATLHDAHTNLEARYREREMALSRALADMAEAETHREQLLEAERSARSEAERASQLKDEFLATLSHELRTPLNSIVGWAHILQRKAVEQPTFSQGLDVIERNARAQAKLIEDLLDMSRIVAGKVGLTLGRVSLGDVVEAAAQSLRPAAEAKGVALVTDLAGSDQACVTGDASRLQQVVTNLLGNSLKFTPAGGLIEVRVIVDDGHATLVVRDTGQGIAPEFLPSVFERFRQADGSITRRHGGLGLGLSIAKQIVEMHGGSITATSAGSNLGATFAVTLPLADEAVLQRTRLHEESLGARLRGLRVLVVDDERDAGELMVRLLGEQGCEVTVAYSAEQALVRLSERTFDVMLSDIGMPGIDGYELMRRVRATMSAPPRSVAVTAFARPQDRDRAMAAGFDAHTVKPLTPDRLLRVVAHVAGRPQPPQHAAPQPA